MINLKKINETKGKYTRSSTDIGPVSVEQVGEDREQREARGKEARCLGRLQNKRFPVCNAYTGMD